MIDDMFLDKEKTQQIVRKIKSSKNILLLCHKNPDADAIGSTLAIDIALSKIGKKVTSCSIDEVEHRYLFLPHIYKMQTALKNLKSYDLIIILDCGDHKMTGFHQKTDIFSGQHFIINIDHHISNDNFGNINLVIPEAASTTHIIYNLFKEFNISIDANIATLLMAGIYYDTGSFKHDNTSSEIFLTAEKLARLGARVDLINKYMFQTNSIQTLRLWGEILNNVKINNKKIVSSVLTENDLRRINIDENSLNVANIMNLLDSLPNIKFSVLLTEINGKIKGSFRTSNVKIDVSKIAKNFNGGGHKKAAGFVMNGKIKSLGDRFHSILS